MTNFDDMIKAELAKETKTIDELLAENGGLPDMVAASFKGSMRRWVWVASFFVFVTSGLLLWTGYQFFVSSTLDDRLFWGVCTVCMLIMQGLLKLWTLMEMGRASSMREIKRLELAIAALSNKLGS